MASVTQLSNNQHTFIKHIFYVTELDILEVTKKINNASLKGAGHYGKSHRILSSAFLFSLNPPNLFHRFNKVFKKINDGLGLGGESKS